MTHRPEHKPELSSVDEVTAERLLRGRRSTAGASSDEQELSSLLAAASAPPSARELSGEARAVAAYIATRPATRGPRHARHIMRRRRLGMNPRVSHGVAAAAALGALTVGGVAAAAYTGSLPGSLQKHLGVAHKHNSKPLPTVSTTHHPIRTATAMRSGGSDENDRQPQPGLTWVTPTPAPGSASTGRSAAPGPRSQRYLQCTSYLLAVARDNRKQADAMSAALAGAAGGRDKVAAYCAELLRGQVENLEPYDPPPYKSGHPPLTSPARSPNEPPPN